MWPKVSNHLLRYAIPLLLYCILVQYEANFKYDTMCEIRHKQGLNRRTKVRVKWDEISYRMGDYQFRRMFRMTRECFSLLCATIVGAIGESQFKSEHYFDTFLCGTSMYDANVLALCGYISG